MPDCANCRKPMVRADMYDPDGMVPLEMVEIEGKPWACINGSCPKNQPQTQEGGD